MIVVCASHHHLRSAPATEESLYRIVTEAGVEYLQLPARSYRGNALQRLLNVLDFARRIALLPQLIKEGKIPFPDVVVASSAPLHVFPPARKVARSLRIPVVFEVRDIWPLSLIEVAGVSPWHPLVLWMKRIEKKGYRYADHIVSLLPNALEYMRPHGVSSQRFTCIPNGISLQEWSEPLPPLSDAHAETFRKLKEEGKRVVLYAGSHGPPNALDQILDLKSVVGDSERPYHFVLMGDGVSKAALMARAAAENCSFVTFLPKVSKLQSLAAIKEADICFIGWQDRLIYKYGISPNKLSEYLYAGKPVVHTVPPTIDPVRLADAGISLKPYDPPALDQALFSLCALPVAQLEQLGDNGRAYVAQHLEWSVLAEKYEKVLTGVAARRQQRKRTGATMKRLVDLTAAGAALLLISPLLLALALLVRLMLGSPVLFTQLRPGQHGRPFRIYKFRTMTGERDLSGSLLPDDKRLTRFGKFLRSSSLDELPELINVLKGEMSLVGPRPLLMEYLPLYSTEEARRHEILPGITGWAQVNGRNAISWEERFRLDNWYVENRSFLLDLRILWLTVAKVFRREGITHEGEATMVKFQGHGI
jgi:lipopolysaccharide/colanic/teichoic acid biosynthesis glycosyltransferase